MEKTNSNSGCFFDVNVKYIKMPDNMIVTESFAAKADSFGEAEKSVMEHLSYYGGVDDVFITSVKRSRFKEIISRDKDYEDAPDFFLCSVSYVTVNESNGKEKKTKVYYLVAASDIDDAKSTLNGFLGDSVVDTEILSISSTPIVEIVTKDPGHEEESERND